MSPSSLSPIEDLSALVSGWEVDQVAVGVTTVDGVVGLGGDPHWSTRLASISKLKTAWALLIGCEEGSVRLEDPIGPPAAPGTTLRHLLAHTAGFAFDSPELLAAPGERRIYSNVGIELAAEFLAAQAGMSFSQYLNEAVFGPLGMASTELRGSPAHGVHSSVDDVLRFAREVMRPTLLSPATVREATTVQFGDVPGVLPGFGSHHPNPWGLGFEIRGHKDPHWTAVGNSPRTFGHFGGAGTFLWIDPDRGLACCCLTNRDFGPWAAEVWPQLSAEILRRF